MNEPTTVAVITGAAGGVGRACASRLGRRHRLVLVDVSSETLDPLVAELAAESIEAIAVEGDVREIAAVERVVAAVGGDRLAAVVCAAGLSSHMGAAETIFTVNLVGTARVLDALLPFAGRGTVAVCIASISGHRGGVREFDAEMEAPLRDGIYDSIASLDGERWSPGMAYAVSKRGVIIMCEREARRWGERGARLVSISPGLIHTPMGRFEVAQHDGNAKQLADLAALGRGAEADEIAAVVEFLCGPGATYVTGCDIRVDGGTVAELEHHSGPEVVKGWFRPGY